ncbi:MinD/ParA family ATP-binding protein [Gordonia paraffinivorans]|uniref:MinD/ParA family ATP-binding protein n=1 Tax=Gordonia paraffinivorans TaxID=175628 RepID=UPI001444B67E|nr:MinD/ParA family protein [Gordonia paraffinivorans]
MTHENPTTPNGAAPDAPAPPPWLQFPPPQATSGPGTPPAQPGPAVHRTPPPAQAPTDVRSADDDLPAWFTGGPAPSDTGVAPRPDQHLGAPGEGPRPQPGGEPMAGAPGFPAEYPGARPPSVPGPFPTPPGPGGPHPDPIQAGAPQPGPPPFPPHGPARAHPVPEFQNGASQPVSAPPVPPVQGPSAPFSPAGPTPAYPGQQMPGPGPQAGPSLDEVALIRKARRAPSRGWRRAVHTLSAGAINPGESQSDIAYQQLLERVNRPVRGDYRIAVLSLKGGVGKTTTTVGLGSTFASLRGDRVIAVDANPDLGTLAQRIPQQTRSTVRDLLADQNVYRYSDVRAHTSQAPSRLEVLASERDPAMAEAFNEEEYRGVIAILQRFYNIIITDCGTGLSHSAMNGVLALANTIILVSSPALDGARSAGATLDWLEAHGFGHLVSRAVVVLSSSRPGSSTIDTDQLAQHFLTRCRAVHKIPFDDHLAEGADVDLDLMSKSARRAFVELAATIADDFSGTTLPREEPYFGRQ